VDRLVSEAFKETDEDVREQLYLQIAEHYATDMPLIYRAYATEFFVSRFWLKGCFFNPWCSGLHRFWLSK